MKNFKIIEYKPIYAKSISKMWNDSKEGWCGWIFNKTEKSVKIEEENSEYINLFLAVNKDKVIGYCKLSEYKQDEGALYIDMLNVLPQYHGEKIGKALVLKCVERTKELKWSRLDLYTWPGNTKAVPLYKKSGFFWEDREDCTHLMNFIPEVLNTELFEDYFKKFHWYNNNERKIEINPDGRKENEFNYYRYHWHKNEKYLILEYCRRGRGLRKVATDKFEVTATIDNLNLVFGKKYKICYEVYNKSSNYMNIEIEGVNDKNISFDFYKKINVKCKISIYGEFYVNKIEGEQSIWKTHPVVKSIVKINEKKALFKIGIVPEYPVNILMESINTVNYEGAKSLFYVNLENNVNENIEVSLNLPKNKNLVLLQSEFKINLKSKEKISIKIPFILNKSCLYSPELSVEVIDSCGKSISFKRKIGCAFSCNNGILYGETEKYYIIGNGKFQLKLDKYEFFNEITISDVNNESECIYIMEPSIGKPFSSEHTRILPESVNFIEKNGSIILKIVCNSIDFKDIKYNRYFKLFSTGLLEHWNEFYFKDKTYQIGDITTEYFFKEFFYINFYKPVIPYEGKYIKNESEYYTNISQWEHSKLTENWLFKYGKKLSVGICWDKEDAVLFTGEGDICFKNKLNNLTDNGKHITKPITIAMNTFQDWHEFREFALKKKLKRENLRDCIEIKINDHNPFVKDLIPIKLENYSIKKLNGELLVTSKVNPDENFDFKFSVDSIKRHIEFKIDLKTKSVIDLIDIKLDLGNLKYSTKKVIFHVYNQKLVSSIKKTQDKKVLKIDNGLISIKANPNFSPGIFSCKYNNNEWLHSSYPERHPKSWYNPWAGGLYCYPERYDNKSLFNEMSKAEFSTKVDTFGNEWTGIKIKTKISNYKKLNNLQWHQYFMLLPGLPVLMYKIIIYQNTGKYLRHLPINTCCFIKVDEEIKNTSFILQNKDGGFTEIISGGEGLQYTYNSCFTIQGKRRKIIIFCKS